MILTNHDRVQPKKNSCDLKPSFFIIKKLRLYYVSIHTNFYQNLVINECATKNLTTIPLGRKDLFCET